jgi:hypothetical protein
MIGGFMMALIVAFAEIWFLFKKLNEMDNLTPTVRKQRPFKKRLIDASESIKSDTDKKKD